MGGSGVRIKKANKKATKGKIKPWKKGQSSVYNPECNKYRLEAKKRAVFGNPGVKFFRFRDFYVFILVYNTYSILIFLLTGFGNLTEEKLAAHNRWFSENQCDDDESMSVSADSAISAFTNCSLPAFNRLVNNFL